MVSTDRRWSWPRYSLERVTLMATTPSLRTPEPGKRLYSFLLAGIIRSVFGGKHVENDYPTGKLQTGDYQRANESHLGTMHNAGVCVPMPDGKKDGYWGGNDGKPENQQWTDGESEGQAVVQDAVILQFLYLA